MSQPTPSTSTTVGSRMMARVISTVRLIFYLVTIGGLAHAEEVARVTHLNGPLFSTTENGAKRILAPSSEINSGDTLITAGNTYARIKFADEGEVTLKPNTQFKVEEFRYDVRKPEKSSAFFNLIKGGLRAISGFIGRSAHNRDRYRMTAASATIGIRGTIYGVNLCQGGSCGDGIPDGLHVDVSKGAVVVSNEVGTQQLNAGQFGYVQGARSKPTVLPENPGVKFTPPATFTNNSDTHSMIGRGSGIGATSGGSCEVH